MNSNCRLQLKQLRHVRILFMDSYRKPHGLVAGTLACGRRQTAGADLVRCLCAASRSVARYGSSSVDRSDPVVIVGEPADEIAEPERFPRSPWSGSFSSATLGLLYVVLGRVLDPLANLSKASILEDGHYATRLRYTEGQGACAHHRALQHAGRRARHRARREQPPLPAAHLRAGARAPRDRQRTSRRGRVPAFSASPPTPRRFKILAELLP